MDAKTYLRISLINLTFLLVGVLIGSTVAISVLTTATVHAQEEKGKAPSVPAKIDGPKEPATPPSCDESKFECVAPGLSTGKAAFGIILAGRIASDQLMVNGYEPLKLHDATLAVLQSKNILTAEDVKRIVAAAKVEKPLRLK